MSPCDTRTAGGPADGLAQPALLLCDEDCQVVLANDAARRLLGEGAVMLWRGRGVLAVRSHGVGWLALRKAVRQAAREGLAQTVELRHGAATLRVSVAPLLGADAHWPCALLALGDLATPQSLADLLSGWPESPLAPVAGP